jgi:hypothetical protein
MRSVKALFALFVAVVAAGLALSATASAAEIGVLPASSFTVTSGAGKFVSKNGLTLSASTDKGSGEFAEGKDNLGTFKVTFEKVKGPVACVATGLSDTSGNVSVSGTFHVGLSLGESPSDVPVIAFFINEVHLTCGGVLTFVRGCAIGKIDTLKGKETVILLHQKEGVNEFTDFSLELGATAPMFSCILETSTGGGAFQQSGEETEESTTFSSEVEVMNL